MYSNHHQEETTGVTIGRRQGYLLLLSLLVDPALMAVAIFVAFCLLNPIFTVMTEAFFAMNGSVGSSMHWIIIDLLQWKNWLIVYGIFLLPLMLAFFWVDRTRANAVLRATQSKSARNYSIKSTFADKE